MGADEFREAQLQLCPGVAQISLGYRGCRVVARVKNQWIVVVVKSYEFLRGLMNVRAETCLPWIPGKFSHCLHLKSLPFCVCLELIMTQVREYAMHLSRDLDPLSFVNRCIFDCLSQYT